MNKEISKVSRALDTIASCEQMMGHRSGWRVRGRFLHRHILTLRVIHNRLVDTVRVVRDNIICSPYTSSQEVIDVK